MKVLKFGGTSVGTVESLGNVKKIVEGLEGPAVVVVSALGGITDKLIATAKQAKEGGDSYEEAFRAICDRHHATAAGVLTAEAYKETEPVISELLRKLGDLYKGVSLLEELSDRTLDSIVSFGERISSVIVSRMISDARHFDSPSIIKTERWHGKNIADVELTDKLIKENFGKEDYKIAVCGGFISRDRDNNDITNLGRGGSDYTAALIAASLGAEELEIWTDVDGFMTADPRIVKTAMVLDKMTFVESMQLCTFGAKVIYPPTIYPVFHKNIPIKILNTFHPEAPGTLITDECTDNLPAKGVTALKGCALIRVAGSAQSDDSDIKNRIYKALSRQGVNVLLVAPQRGDSFSLVVNGADGIPACEALENEFAPELSSSQLKGVELIENLATVAVVGENLRRTPDLGLKIGNSIIEKGLKVIERATGGSETMISFVVDQTDADATVLGVHEAIFG